MNTFLSSAQEAQLEQYRAFAQNEVAPVAQSLVNHEACLKEFLQKLGQKGYLGLNVPKEYGGHGGSLLDVVFFVEAVSAYDPGLALTLGNHAAAIEAISKYGTDQQKSRYLPLLARGEGFATLAFSEQTAGTDFEAVQSNVSGTGSAATLAGKKTWVVTGDFASLFVVLAKNEAGELVLSLVDRPADKTFELMPERRLMGLRSAYVNDIEFKSAKLTPEAALATGDKARQAALYAMDVAKVVLSAGALGLLESGKEIALAHARERQQFGQSIGQFQGVQWKLADMGVDCAGARLQTYRAAWANSESPEHFHEYAAMSKLFASRAARFQSGEALQIMGAAGLAEDNPLSRFYDDAKAMEIAQGTAEFQKMLLVPELNI